jgi:hypothetical protein
MCCECGFGPCSWYIKHEIAGWLSVTPTSGWGRKNGQYEITIALAQDPSLAPPHDWTSLVFYTSACSSDHPVSVFYRHNTLVEIYLNGVIFEPGDTLNADVWLQERIERPLSVYMVLITPGGAVLDVKTLKGEYTPLAIVRDRVRRLKYSDVISLDIPQYAPKGLYKVYLGLFEPEEKVVSRKTALMLFNTYFIVE